VRVAMAGLNAQTQTNRSFLRRFFSKKRLLSFSLFLLAYAKP
jgi:hypothetical protein